MLDDVVKWDNETMIVVMYNSIKVEGETEKWGDGEI